MYRRLVTIVTAKGYGADLVRSMLVALVVLALHHAARQVPPEVLYAAWPAEPRLLARLIGDPAPADG
jgi:hypothetical protein